MAWLLTHILKILCKKQNVSFSYDEEYLALKDKQIILLCQHKSSNDFVYVFGGIKRLDVHILVGYQNIFQKGVYHILKSLGAIAKMLYQPDVAAVAQTLQALKLGESVVIFPEGIQSTSGSTHPINPGTMHLLMKCKLPVALATIEGSYFAKPRFTRELRKGEIKVHYSKLFDPADFDTYSQEVLYQRLLDSFKYNEFEEHKENKIAFRGKTPNITGLDNIIYKCPHCLAEHQFSITGDVMRCSACGFAVSMDEYYDIHPQNHSLPFANIDEWYKWQRQLLAREVQSPDFSMSLNVMLRKIDTQKLRKNYSLVYDGEGVLTITNRGLVYRGTKGEEQVELQFAAKNVYSLSISLAYDFDMYCQGRYYNFKILENEKHMTKWMIAAEEIHNLYDPAWKEASEQVYEYAKEK